VCLACHQAVAGAGGFWRWLLAYRRRSRPLILQAIAAHAPGADLHLL
jgi:hypothetical protein